MRGIRYNQESLNNVPWNSIMLLNLSGNEYEMSDLCFKISIGEGIEFNTSWIVRNNTSNINTITQSLANDYW
jgi:hypothetical protein